MVKSNLAAMEASPHSMDDNMFRLPAEVRNMIYEFALTHEQGMFTHIAAGRTPVPELFVNTGNGATIPRDIEANMLNQICRQMYQETWQLGLLYNNLIFRKSGSTPALSVCEKVLTAVPALSHRNFPPFTTSADNCQLLTSSFSSTSLD